MIHEAVELLAGAGGEGRGTGTSQRVILLPYGNVGDLPGSKDTICTETGNKTATRGGPGPRAAWIHC